MGKIVVNYLGFIAFFMAIMAAFRYFTGGLEQWDWKRTFFIAAAVGLYSVWRNNKRTQNENTID